MISAPKTFTDPIEKPVRFSQRLPVPVSSFGESWFPVSFSFDGSPRSAVFLAAAATQLGVVLTDKEIDNELSGVMQYATGSSQTIELYANGSDIETTEFYLKIPTTDGGIHLLPKWKVAEIRQPSYSGGISHSFKNGNSTFAFDPVNDGGTLYYPAATMTITTLPTLVVGNGVQETTTTGVGDTTWIAVAPPSSCGLVDIKVDISISWYTDEARTISTGAPLVVSIPGFGIRIFVSSPSKYAQHVELAGAACLVGSLYPTTILKGLGGDSVNLVYWGAGADGNGLFWGMETGIEVSANGLALQSGLETASYLLPNLLEDYDFSSSSSSSPSSLNSSSSSSIPNTSSQSTHTSASSQSFSTKSSSSKSSASFSSSSSSSSKSLSSQSYTSTSSSTVGLTSSSSSSPLKDSLVSSGSSLVASILARYGMGTAPTADGKVADDSGNGNEMTLAPVSGALGPPVWDSTGGRCEGGGFRFYANTTNTNYMSMSSQPWSTPRGTISFWAMTSGVGNMEMVVICLSNGMVAEKTEVAVAIDVTEGREVVTAWATVNGIAKWVAFSPRYSIPSGAWHNIVLVQNGVVPVMYIDGVAVVLTFSVSVDTKVWLDDIATAVPQADRVVIGATPRSYSPYMALGFSGLLDEVTLWDEALSASDADAIYHSVET